MQKSILLHLVAGGTVSIGTDHYVSAERLNNENTIVTYESYQDADCIYSVTETPKEIYNQLNLLKD